MRWRTLSRVFRRPFTSASDAASTMIATHSQVLIRQQHIDGNQLQKLALTLGRTTIGDHDITTRPPPDGTPLPPGHHLVYFTPSGTEASLGPDGTDLTFNAPAPYTRRMWAGGQMSWAAEPLLQLRTGDIVEEHTRLLSAVPKKSRSGAEMVLVEVEKQFRGPRGPCVLDRRSWIFRQQIDPKHDRAYTSSPGRLSRTPTVIADISQEDGSYLVRQLTWSPVGLFRFSALTFNGHKIHYDEGWSQGVEGHPGIVVHGPLNLINILDYWRDIHGQGTLRRITYRALSPLYAGDTYRIKTTGVADRDGETVYDIVAEKSGTVCMKSRITAK